MKRILAVLLALALCAFPALAEETRETAAESISLLEVKGGKNGATLYRGADLPVAAVRGMRLVAGDTVATDAKSTAFLLADKDRLFQLDPMGSVCITQKDARTLKMSLLAGVLYFNVKSPLAEDESLEINAGSATMSIRGTSGIVSFQDNLAVIALRSGQVDVAVGDAVHAVSAGAVLFAYDKDGACVVEVIPTDPADPSAQDEAIRQWMREHGFSDEETGAVLSDMDKGMDGFDNWSEKATCGCAEGGHAKLLCGHYACDKGGPHEALCSHCKKYMCNNRAHAPCGRCGGYDCVGEHGDGICYAKVEEESGPASVFVLIEENTSTTATTYIYCPGCSVTVAAADAHWCVYSGEYHCLMYAYNYCDCGADMALFKTVYTCVQCSFRTRTENEHACSASATYHCERSELNGGGYCPACTNFVYP